ncbi:MAG: hypothetical protein ABS75_30940 [Pelagibacterium sp. SCN 63-23]|jgi:hypothetical protein|nr:MAG: hypothetical protein ABS75_30940 [Pelagibacterium sp. SCN 63-23]
MNRIDRPALRVSSHRRSAAALARFVHRHGLWAETKAAEPEAPSRAKRMAPMTIELLLREEEE